MSRPPPRPPDEPQQPSSSREQARSRQDPLPPVDAGSGQDIRGQHFEEEQLSQPDHQRQRQDHQVLSFPQGYSTERRPDELEIGQRRQHLADELLQWTVARANAAGFFVLSLSLAPAPWFYSPSIVEQSRPLARTASSVSPREPVRATVTTGSSSASFVGEIPAGGDVAAIETSGETLSRRQSFSANLIVLSEPPPPLPPPLPLHQLQHQATERDRGDHQLTSPSPSSSVRASPARKRATVSLPSLPSVGTTTAKVYESIGTRPTYIPGSSASSPIGTGHTPLKRRRPAEVQSSPGFSSAVFSAGGRFWGTVLPPFVSDAQQSRPVLPPPEAMPSPHRVGSPQTVLHRRAHDLEALPPVTPAPPSYRPSHLSTSTFLRAAEHVRPRLSSVAEASAVAAQQRRSSIHISNLPSQLTPIPIPAHLAGSSDAEMEMARRRSQIQLPSLSLRQQAQLTDEQRLQVGRYQIPAHQSVPSLMQHELGRTSTELSPYSVPQRAYSSETEQPSARAQQGGQAQPPASQAPSVPAFACDSCPARFRRKSDRNRHVRVVHEKQRPFVCNICQSAFGEKSNMSKHIKMVHENIRTFQCPHCSAAFGQRGNCDAHVRAVHEKNKFPRYACPICSKAFLKKSQLAEHVCEGRESYRVYTHDVGREEFPHDSSTLPYQDPHAPLMQPGYHMLQPQHPQQPPQLPPPPPAGGQYHPRFMRSTSETQTDLLRERFGPYPGPGDRSGYGSIAGPSGTTGTSSMIGEVELRRSRHAETGIDFSPSREAVSRITYFGAPQATPPSHVHPPSTLSYENPPGYNGATAGMGQTGFVGLAATSGALAPSLRPVPLAQYSQASEDHSMLYSQARVSRAEDDSVRTQRQDDSVSQEQSQARAVEQAHERLSHPSREGQQLSEGREHDLRSTARRPDDPT